VHCEVALVFTVDGLHATWTEVIVEGGCAVCTVMAEAPDLVGSSVLVAVMVTVPADAGAVKVPLVLMVPPLADQMTAEL
jgi:hypothetical protein